MLLLAQHQVGAAAGAQRDLGDQVPAQTPAALTTVAGATVVRLAGQLVAQLDPGAGRGQHPGAGADVGAVRGGRAGDGGDQPGVVLELAVPGEQRAAQAVRAEAGASWSASVAESRRGRGSMSDGGAGAAPQQVAGASGRAR